MGYAEFAFNMTNYAKQLRAALKPTTRPRSPKFSLHGNKPKSRLSVPSAAKQHVQPYQNLRRSFYTPIRNAGPWFLRVVDYMGDDGAVVQAARVSYGRGTRQISDDRGLIRYLMRNRHTSPFEMCEIKLHVKLPIFVARQWIRHRTASVNEYSARYSILDREFYVPSPDVISAQSRRNRQGRDEQLPIAEASRIQELLREDAVRAYDHYEDFERKPKRRTTGSQPPRG